MIKAAPHIQELLASRRALLGGLASLPLLNLAGCATSPPAPSATTSATANFQSVAATNADTVTLPAGYRWRTLIGWGDALFEGMAPFDPDTLTRAEQERRFGQSADMLAHFPAQHTFPTARDAERLILCANNEYASVELSFPSVRSPADFTAEQVQALYAGIGVTVVALQRTDEGWRVVRNGRDGSGVNRRITPFTPVSFSGPAARHPWIAAAGEAVNRIEPHVGGESADGVRCGTHSNCAGGQTPWGTYLTAEENFQDLFFGGDRDVRTQYQEEAYAIDASSFGYPIRMPIALDRIPAQFRITENPHGPSLYGWIVEIDPYDPTSTPKKRTALGRKRNECATTALTRDGRVAVYTGDDQRDEHVYKFVTRDRFDPANRTANMDLLDHGQLYTARFEEDGSGRWLALTVAAANAAAAAQDSPIRFHDEGDLVVRARIAARLLGATPMDRPEDVEAVRDDAWRGLGPVLIACTNNSDRGFEHPGNPRRQSASSSAQSNLPGHIVRIDEDGGDCGAETFRWDVFAMGGDPNTDALTAPLRSGQPAHISTTFNGAQTTSGDRFACPDNIFIDSTHRVWIATDGSDNVFGDCNDCIMVTPLQADGPRHMKRFLVGPMGSEICGPLMAPDERAFFCSIQHPGGNDVAGNDFSLLRFAQGQRTPPSNFPDGGDAWPRSAVVVITREDGGRIGD